MTDSLVKISLCHRHALMVEDCAFSHKLDLTVCDLWYYEDMEEKTHLLTEWMNELISEEAVHRTAMATLGLLNRWKSFFWRNWLNFSTRTGPIYSKLVLSTIVFSTFPKCAFLSEADLWPLSSSSGDTHL